MAELTHLDQQGHARMVDVGDKALPVGALIAINHDYCTLDQLLKDNDEVAYFPPVTGG